jgi:hypothetical protein
VFEKTDLTAPVKKELSKPSVDDAVSEPPVVEASVKKATGTKKIAVKRASKVVEVETAVEPKKAKPVAKTTAVKEKLAKPKALKVKFAKE